MPRRDDPRISRALVLGVAVALTILASKHLALPETAVSAYLIFFATRDDDTTTIATAFGLILASVVAIAILIVLLMAVSGNPAIRVPVMFVVAFFSMLGAARMENGVIAATVGMVLFEVLSVLDFLPYPDLALRGLFWVSTVVLVPMTALIAIHGVAGRTPGESIEVALGRRRALIWEAIARQGPAAAKACARALSAGGASLRPLRRLMRPWGLTPAAARTAAVLEDRTARILARGAAGLPLGTEALAELDRPPTHSEEALVLGVSEQPRPQEGESDEWIRFALTATLAVGIAYIVFLLTDWPDIHTITITVFLVSLSSRAETFHKAGLRIVGCGIGGVVSAVALVAVVPRLESAAGLALVAAVVSVASAWVALSGRLVGYAGMQIALVFFLTVCNTPGPDIDLSVAWGRFVGVLLGNVIVAATFLTFLPAEPLERLSDALADLRSRNDDRRTSQPGDGLVLLGLLDEIQELLDSIVVTRFDPLLDPGRRTALDALENDLLRLRVVVLSAGLEPPEPPSSPSKPPSDA